MGSNKVLKQNVSCYILITCFKFTSKFVKVYALLFFLMSSYFYIGFVLYLVLSVI